MLVTKQRMAAIRRAVRNQRSVGVKVTPEGVVFTSHEVCVLIGKDGDGPRARWDEMTGRIPTGLDIDFEVKEGQIAASWTRSGIRQEASFDAAEDFTCGPWGLDTTTVETPGLAEALRTAAVFTDSESKRYALQGILVTKGTVVATDGRRLFYMNGGWPELGIVQNAEWLWPLLDDDLRAGTVLMLAREAAIVGRAVDGEDEKPLPNDSHVTFEQGDMVIALRLMEGHFPAWRDVVPAVATTPLHRDTAARWLAACDAVPKEYRAASEDDVPQTFVSADAANILVEVGSLDGVIVSGMVGEEEDMMSYDSKYIADALRAGCGDGLGMTDKGVLLMVGPDRGHVVMPLEGGDKLKNTNWRQTTIATAPKRAKATPKAAPPLSRMTDLECVSQVIDSLRRRLAGADGAFIDMALRKIAALDDIGRML